MPEWWRTGLGPDRVPSTDQVDAITASPTGRRTVEAGAGTGKTSTLALRALYLIESGHVRADQIVVVTFTNKAATEIGSRIADTIDRAIAQGAEFAGAGRGVRCMTIHALAADILREFAFDFGYVSPPRAIGDGEAYGIFHDVFRALLNGKIAVDTSALPIAEVNLDSLERDLGKLALRLKNHGISPREFGARALAEADRFGAQTWGQLWTAGKGGPIDPAPKNEPLSPRDLVREAERERTNIAVVRGVFEAFDRLLQQRGLATYGDLIGDATRRLREHPRIVSLLRARWRYVLLDESQDTSALQFALIETLFGTAADADAAGIMPVGDRRQAIYGFNGADEGVMERIAASADSVHPLVVNRRSPQEIVDAGHAVLQAAGVIDTGVNKLEASAGSATMACIRVEHFGEAKQTGKDRVKSEAKAIAREIARLVHDASVTPSDIAILLRRRTYAAVYVRALNEHGIPAALDRRSGLFGADEVRDALAWMSLLVDLSDRQAAVRILQSPLCGLNDATMIDVAASDDWLERLLRDESSAVVDADGGERLARVRAWIVALLPCVAMPLGPAVTTLIRDLPIAAGYVRIAETVGEQAIVNLRSFEALAIEFARDHPGSRLVDFVLDVKRRILYDDEPQEADLDIDGVRVMTIHQAKGLEWPYVFVACSTRYQYGTAGPSDALVRYDLGSGAFALKNDVDGRETFRWLCLGNEHDSRTGRRIVPPNWKMAAEREQARVFYVALTRAQRRVYVTTPTPLGVRDHAVFLNALRAWADDVSPDMDLTFDPCDERQDDVDERERNGARIRAQECSRETRIVARTVPSPRVEHSLFEPRISFTSLSAFATCPRKARLQYRLLLPGLRERQPRFVGVDREERRVTDARRIGTLTHRALELWGAVRMHGGTASIDDAFASATLEFADVTQAEAADSRERARRAVEKLGAFEIVAVEEPFETTVGGVALEGAIDLIARAPNGVLYVIDYKTGMTDDEHYDLQLALYRHAYAQRTGADTVGTILRLTPTSADLSPARTVELDELQAFVTSAGRFESDLATPGPWCGTCAYRRAPCLEGDASYATSRSTLPSIRHVASPTSAIDSEIKNNATIAAASVGPRVTPTTAPASATGTTNAIDIMNRAKTAEPADGTSA